MELKLYRGGDAEVRRTGYTAIAYLLAGLCRNTTGWIYLYTLLILAAIAQCLSNAAGPDASSIYRRSDTDM